MGRALPMTLRDGVGLGAGQGRRHPRTRGARPFDHRLITDAACRAVRATEPR